MIPNPCDRLDDYFDGALDGAGRAAFEEHLAGCQACRREAAAQRLIDRRLAAAAERLEEAPPALARRIEAHLRAAERRPALRRAALRAAAAALLLAAGAWLLWRAPRGDDPAERRIADRAAEEPAPAPRPRVRVSFDADANVIAERKVTKDPGVTILFVYPAVSGAEEL